MELLEHHLLVMEVVELVAQTLVLVVELGVLEVALKVV